jgi:hypothetical protein
MPPHKQPYYNTYGSYNAKANKDPFTSWEKRVKKQESKKKRLLRVKVYAKIKRLRQRIYNWKTIFSKNGQWKKDLKFVGKEQENMDNYETYYPNSNTLREMNILWLEYYDRLNPNNFEYNKFSDIIDE